MPRRTPLHWIMQLLTLLRALWRALARRREANRALDDELRVYVELLAGEYERSGLPPEEARRAARIETGGVQQVKEATRDAWVGEALATGARELRYTVRSLGRSPAFVVIAVTTLALGIGGATAIFTIIKASLLHPLPGVAEPEQLVTVETRESDSFSYPAYRAFRDHTTALAGLSASVGAEMAVKDAVGDTHAFVGFVSDNFFTVLGVRPATGRLFSSSEAGASGAPNHQVVVLGYEWWQRRFGGAADVIGSVITLNGYSVTVIGVAPPGFIGAMELFPLQMWTPLVVGNRASPPLAAYGFDPESRRFGWVRLVGRLAPGTTVDEAQHELAITHDWLAATYPMDRGVSAPRVLAGAGMTAEERAMTSRMPRLLGAAVALLLLIACGNVASLSLVRAAARQRELATRVALGASRAALVRQVIAEAAVLASAAGLLGLLAARGLVSSATLVHTIVSMPGPDLSLDGRVLAVAIGASALTAILVALVPALQNVHVQPGAVLKEGGGAVRRRSAGGQRALVAAQVAASLVLLSAAAIIVSAFHRMVTAQEWIDPQGLTNVYLNVEASVHDTAQQVAFYRAVLARAAAEPGIAGAAVTSTIPPFEWGRRATVFRRGEEPPPGALAGRELQLGLRVSAVTVSPGFFDVVRLPLVRGRVFSASDNEQSARVVIVNRRLAEALWPGQDPIGRFLSWPAVEGPPRQPLRVVGVAADTRNVSLTGVPLAMYVPFAQHPGSNLHFVVRARGRSSVPPETLRCIVADVNTNVGVSEGGTLLEALERAGRAPRAASAWIGVFGAIALLLAAIGLYGVVAQGVLQRTRELAVRAALGASPGGILRTVLGDGLRLAAIGAVVGALGVLATLHVLRSLFTVVALVDLRAAVVAAPVLALAMLAATILPARRAARLDPAEALRSE